MKQRKNYDILTRDESCEHPMGLNPWYLKLKKKKEKKRCVTVLKGVLTMNLFTQFYRETVYISKLN